MCKLEGHNHPPITPLVVDSSRTLLRKYNEDIQPGYEQKILSLSQKGKS